MDQIQETLTAWLQDELDDTRLALVGGYPSVVNGTAIPGYIVVATVNDQDEPRLHIYKWSDLEALYDTYECFIMGSEFMDRPDDYPFAEWAQAAGDSIWEILEDYA